MARALTIKERGVVYAPTTVQSWKDTGRIPSSHWKWVIERARDCKIAVEMDELLKSIPSKPRARRRPAHQASAAE